MSSNVTDTTYFSIQAWMVTKLNLKGCERDVYAIIYGYSQDGDSDYHGSLGYMAELTGYSKNSVCTALKTLTEKELIIKTEKEINNIKFCRYQINRDSIQSTCTPIQSTCINNNIDNKTENKNNNSKELLKNSGFEFGKEKSTPKKESLYSKCTAMINDFTKDKQVISDLTIYLHILLEMRKDGYSLYTNVWKGLLRKLKELSDDPKEQHLIISQSVERGYKSFYPVNNWKSKDYDVTKGKSWEENVSCRQATPEELAEIERLNKEREAKGLRTKF